MALCVPRIPSTALISTFARLALDPLAAVTATHLFYSATTQVLI
jgi:hypothetical protein